MNTGRLSQRAEDIFYDLLGVERAGRSAALDAACGTDESLKAEVRSLLANHLDEPAFLETGGVRQLAGMEEIAPLAPGAKVAGYTVQGVLGAGGMGVVYVAEQDRPRRTVALKLVRRSAAGLLRRFEHEAEVLGRLHHPGIAQIYEAGAAEIGGRGATPFIAMELVQGRTLTEYAASISTRQRLELMARVCEGVQHAHQRGIIHRDLKPANILVDAQGQPKVLDFGVARAAESGLSLATAGTSAGQIVGTLQYMSPEQARADPGDIDTRSDVYALGVMLFQVLTGRLPHDLAGRTLPEASRQICDAPAPRISTIDRSLRGDVETIVVKALEKEKDRRYRSAADLGEDIRRFLDGRPIAARNDAALYTLQKVVRRHVGAVAAGVASITALAWFAVYASVQSNRNRELARAEQRATTEALSSLKAAKEAREVADNAATRLKAELATSTVERGRLLARAGNLPAAEALLWPAFLRDPDSRQAHWALWELYAHEPCLATIKAPVGATGGALSPDGKTLYTIGTDDGGIIQLWDTATNAPTDRIRAGFGVGMGLSLSKDGQYLAISCADGQVVIWDLASRSERLRFAAHSGQARGVAFHPDGTKLATAGDDKLVRLWDARTGAHIGDMPGEFRFATHRVVWSPDGSVLAASSMLFDGRIALWDGVGQPRFLTGHTQSVGAMAFSPDGATLASGGSDRDIRLWDVASGKFITKLVAPNGTVRTLRYTPDGSRLVSSGYWSIDVWDVAARRKERSFSLVEAVSETLMNADASRLYACFAVGLLQVWDLSPSPGRVRLAGHDGRIDGVLSADARLAVTGDSRGVLRFWDAATGRLLTGFRAHAGRIKAMKISPDGRLLATGGEEGQIRLWDLRSGTLLATAEALSPVSGDSIAFSPDSHILAVGRQDMAVAFLRVPSLALVHSLPAGDAEIVSVRFSPDGHKLASVARDRMIRVWNLADESCTFLTMPRVVSPWTTSFSPDGARLAAGDWGKNVQLWDLAAAKQCGNFRGHGGLVSMVEFDPADPAIVASAGAEGTVRLWDTNTGLTLASLEDYIGYEALTICFSADGRHLLTTGTSGEAAVWDLRAFDRHIAWNAEYQVDQLAKDLGPDLRAEQVRTRCAAALADASAPAPLPEPLAIGPETIEAWAQTPR